VGRDRERVHVRLGVVDPRRRNLGDADRDPLVGPQGGRQFLAALGRAASSP